MPEMRSWTALKWSIFCFVVLCVGVVGSFWYWALIGFTDRVGNALAVTFSIIFVIAIILMSLFSTLYDLEKEEEETE